MGLSRRQFTKEFKLAAVRRLEQGVSITEAARALEVSPNRERATFFSSHRPLNRNLLSVHPSVAKKDSAAYLDTTVAPPE